MEEFGTSAAESRLRASHDERHQVVESRLTRDELVAGIRAAVLGTEALIRRRKQTPPWSAVGAG